MVPSAPASEVKKQFFPAPQQNKQNQAPQPQYDENVDHNE